MPERGTAERPVLIGQRESCREAQRRVWRAIDLLRQRPEGVRRATPVAMPSERAVEAEPVALGA